ncbi:MAG TPA: hypothetical protein VN153_06990, partial [Tahibacter sp.]|nr:hypothetical protein [Tahibacter sp.]
MIRRLFLCLLPMALTVTATAFAQTNDAAPAPAPLPSVTLPPAIARVLRDYEKAWIARDDAALASLF